MIGRWDIEDKIWLKNHKRSIRYGSDDRTVSGEAFSNKRSYLAFCYQTIPDGQFGILYTEIKIVFTGRNIFVFFLFQNKNESFFYLGAIELYIQEKGNTPDITSNCQDIFQQG